MGKYKFCLQSDYLAISFKQLLLSIRRNKVSLVSSLPPRFSKEEVRKIVEELYELNVTVCPLVSDIGQNFHVADQSGNEFVFKIANPEENKEMLDMQNKTIEQIAINNKSINSPRVYKTALIFGYTRIDS